VDYFAVAATATAAVITIKPEIDYLITAATAFIAATNFANSLKLKTSVK
jgi:hypothetical protein